MNKENRKIIWSEIIKAGNFLKGKLPKHSNHPKGRNPYAHVALEIKNKFQKSYKDISDNQINDLRSYIEFIKNNPS